PRHDHQPPALPGDSAHRCETPAHPCRLDRLTYHLHAPGRLECEVRTEAAGELDDLLHSFRSTDHRVRRALAAGEGEALLGEIDADDSFRALQSAAGDCA